MARRRDKDAAPAVMPSREAIRDFIRQATGRVGKREIERAFRLGPEHRVGLRGILKDMAGEGVIAPAGHRRFAPPGRLPDATIVQVTGTDPDGDAVARPVAWEGDGPPPMVLMAPEPKGQPALAPGQRVLARLRPIGHGKYEGRTLKRLTDAPGRVLGVFRAPDRLVPTDRRQKAEWTIAAADTGGAEDGEIVLCAPMPSRSYGLKSARVVERLGRMGDARSVSLICIHTHEIPTEFSAEALADAAAAQAVPLGAREDLRALPLVTIDGEDARDFDDAVFAEADGAGFRLIVAIADVAHYVPTGAALDRAAWERGNSVYFPDRVVPMLPEALSNGWCSLRPDEERGCLFVEMRVDAAGRKTGHRFGRGLMRSAARLTYEQVQDARDAGADLGLPLPALYAAFQALLAARQARGTLDLDLPERRVVLDAAGGVTAITPRPRLDSHRLIEEFMVLANVAAAETLEQQHLPCMYRVHAPPSDEKMEALRAFLHGMSIGLPPAGQVHPRDLDGVLKQVAGTEQAPLVNEVMLRSQSQAQYSPENIGHFGLALSRYAHFTSPIRRYADLCVHRALIRGLGAGPDGLTDAEAARFEDTAEHITATERRAALAEREAIDRYLAAFMADKTGAVFPARISGVTRFGLFVTLADTGASGLVPLSALPDDFWAHDEAAKTLTARRSGQSYHLAQSVDVRLVEASPVTGGLVFSMAPRHGQPGEASGRPPVIRASFLIVLLSLLPSLTRAQGLDEKLAASVFSTALAFIAPRTLEAQSVPQLTVWGLRGLTALDPALVPELRENTLRLMSGAQVLFSLALPADQSPEAWGLLAAQVVNAAAESSDPVQKAGTAGVIRSFFDELFNHLDPYSRYTPPGDAETERSHRSGEAGLGLTLARVGAAFIVREVIPGSPADDRRIRPGDRITAVDGRALRTEDTAAANALIAGPEGSEVRLTWRGRNGRVHNEAIERAIVPPVTVTAERDGDVLIVTIAGFSKDTDQQFADLLASGFAGHRVRGLIVDLRGNRGGLLRQAVTVVDDVVTSGVVATTSGRHPQSSRVWLGGDGPDAAQGRPVVVLVDGRSASAAEIMAAALEDSGRGVVVGSATLGKGLVQTIAPLPDGGELFVTWSRVLAPLGWPLQGLGVMPQVCTSLGEEALKDQLSGLLHGRQDMAAALAQHNAARAPVPAAQVVELRNACPAAEGRDLDMDAARFLLDHPAAYQAARTAPAQ